MIISEKQIQQLIIIAHAHAANMQILGEYRRLNEVQDLLAEISDQQSEELKEIE